MGEFVLSAIAMLFVTIGPVEVAPTFVALTQGLRPAARRATALLACVIGAGILVAFALGGARLLALLGISLPAFRTAGGILLLKIAADLLLTQHSDLSSLSTNEAIEAQQQSSVAVFPLGIPLIAGPGSITGTILLMSRAHGVAAQGALLAVIATIMAVTFAVMLAAERLTRLLGVIGGNIVARVSGILLAGLAMQFVFDGLAASGIFH